MIIIFKFEGNEKTTIFEVEADNDKKEVKRVNIV